MEVYWYGERGIVNAFVNKVQSQGVDGIKHFLGCIQWADDKSQGWINEVTVANMIVEVGLGQFGDPDLIIVCTTDDNRSFAVFIEAKVVPYLYSAERGGPSAINRQLTLKYRFARAITRPGRNNSIQVTESQLTFANYLRTDEANDTGLIELRDKPRELAKLTVLNLCASAGLFSVPFENFRFVAMTWDIGPFFNVEGFIERSSRPLFLQEDGTEKWDCTKTMVGWLGYESLFRCQELKDSTVEQAFSTMRSSHRPTETARLDMAGPALSPLNINAIFSVDTKNQLTSLESVALDYFPLGSLVRSNGSTSIKLVSLDAGNPKVIVKLLPQSPGNDEHIKLGISTSLQCSLWGGIEFEGPRLFRGQAFYWLTLPPGSDGLEVATRAFAELVDFVPNEEGSEEI